MFDEKKLQEIKEHCSKWEDGVLRKTLDSVPESCEEFRTLSGIPVQRLYLPQQKDYMQDLGFPGEYPYIRGVHATGYRGRMWTMRQYAGYGTAEDTNQRYKYLIEQGQTGLSVAFDLPTQLGYDSDHPLADGEVGKVGVAVDSVQDMELLFRGIPLDKVTTSMTINAPTNVLLAMYITVAAKQGVAQEKLRGTVQNDIFKEYVARGNYIFPPESSIRLVTEIFEYCAQHMPKWNSISISGYHMREAGCTAAQEIAFTLANGAAYVEAALQRGLQIDQFAPRLSFFFNSHMDFFEEIAKFRAARRMWARIMRERYGAKNSCSWMLRYHTQTAGCSLTAQQPENNIIRSTLEALAAVMGGTQSLHTNSYDEAYATPTEKAVQIALRTQQIIAHESGVVNTVDPFAGSYFVEWLTDEMEEQAMKYMERIRSMGEGEYPMLTGVIKGIETGFFHKEISDAAYRYQREVESDARIVVGINKFKMEEVKFNKTLRVDEAVQCAQIERLKKLRKNRDGKKVQDALEKLEKASEGTENLMYPVVKCAGAQATVEEICDVMRSVFGEYKEKTIF